MAFMKGVVTAAPKSYLQNKFGNKDLLSEEDVGDLLEAFQDYVKFNQEVQTSCTKSFQTYLDFGLFDYQKGIVTFKGHRFFLFEVSGTYILELELKKANNKRYTEILFNSAFDTGKMIISEFGKNQKDIFDVLSALGWGEVLPFSSSDKEMKVLANHFPWTKWYKDVDFIIMRGFLSGAISQISGKKVLFEKPVVDLTKGHLCLLFGGKYA